ncbi:hypothetical protein AAF712_010238 [Marasmius tenuissimus]|uniref:Uncharacterized protein n=1 Tax=Marasmius tenuissimus TaxID=585030 RepID=A0ABR2ZP42_9AGAR
MHERDGSRTFRPHISDVSIIISKRVGWCHLGVAGHKVPVPVLGALSFGLPGGSRGSRVKNNLSKARRLLEIAEST